MVRKNLFLRPCIPPEKQHLAQHRTHLFPWHWYSVSTSRNTLLRLCPACFSMICGKNNICQIFPPKLKTPLSRSPLAEWMAKFSPSQLQAQVWSRTWWHRPCGSVSKARLWPSTTPRKPLRTVPSGPGEAEAASKTKSYFYPVLIPRISLFAFRVRIYKL